MTPTVVIWLLLSISNPSDIEMAKKPFLTREACNEAQINKHFEQPKVEHRCVPIRVFVPVKKGAQQ